MGMQIGKVWPALALGFVMAESGTVLAHSTVSSAGPPAVFELAVRAPDVSQFQSIRLDVGSVFQSELPLARDILSSLPAVERGPVAPAGLAKTYALVLSSLGMLGLIALRRLPRTL